MYVVAALFKYNSVSNTCSQFLVRRWFALCVPAIVHGEADVREDPTFETSIGDTTGIHKTVSRYELIKKQPRKQHHLQQLPR